MRGYSRDAFTLIELLTVIAIIALLAAILFPVFSRVREDVRQTTCMSNMHAIYVAIGQYKMDHTGEYPTMLLGAAEDNTGNPWLSGGASPVSADQIKQGFLYKKYINDISVFHCPDDTTVDKTAVATPVYPQSSTFFDFYAGQQPLFNVTNPNPMKLKLGFPFPTLPVGFNGKPISVYAYDSYDMTPALSPAGTYTVTYNRDWTGQIASNDAPYQLKYSGAPADRTVITYCNYHKVVNGANMSPVLLASGTCKPFNSVKVQQLGWTLTAAP